MQNKQLLPFQRNSIIKYTRKIQFLEIFLTKIKKSDYLDCWLYCVKDHSLPDSPPLKWTWASKCSRYQSSTQHQSLTRPYQSPQLDTSAPELTIFSSLPGPKSSVRNIEIGSWRPLYQVALINKRTVQCDGRFLKIQYKANGPVSGIRLLGYWLVLLARVYCTPRAWQRHIKV